MPAPNPTTPPADIVCFSHLRWDFVFQRPHHLMSRFARTRRVFFLEEPVPTEGTSRLMMSTTKDGVSVATPYLPETQRIEDGQRTLLHRLFAEHGIGEYVAWYYTPMALSFSDHLEPRAIVYDCMDELSGFLGAPPLMGHFERQLLDRADLVLTGGRSLYQAKRELHHNVHCYPSSVDADDFVSPAHPVPPPDQAHIPRPRLGYCGVLDERMDLELLAALADACRDWQVILIGPTVKIDPRTLPTRPNLHYLGVRPYAQLPSYLASWDVALIPFARNAATHFISPTKTLEYLAAGKPVVSTAISDVVQTYGQAGLVRIAGSVDEFIAGVEASLQLPDPSWQAAVKDFLSRTSWEATWMEMNTLLNAAVHRRPHTESSAQRGTRRCLCSTT
jgi:glycosyltransferase involved in cell wall biosynthesis